MVAAIEVPIEQELGPTTLTAEQQADGLAKLDDRLTYVLEDVGVAKEHKAPIGHLGLRVPRTFVYKLAHM